MRDQAILNKLSWRLLTEKDSDTVVSLRRQEFQSAHGDRVDLKGLEWNYTDQNSIHLGVFHDEDLISSLRLTLVSSEGAFESMMKTQAPSKFQKGSAILARAATDRSWQGAHLHSLLRFHSLGLCLSYRVHSLWGTCESNSLRMNQLQQIGYEIEKYYDWKDGFYKNSAPVALLVLANAQKISAARDRLLPRLRDFFRPELLTFEKPQDLESVVYL
jgi:hypothetical protein